MIEIAKYKGMSKAQLAKKLISGELRAENCKVCRQDIYYNQAGEVIQDCWCGKTT